MRKVESFCIFLGSLVLLFLILTIRAIPSAASCEIPANPALKVLWEKEYAQVLALLDENLSQETELYWAVSYYSNSKKNWLSYSPWTNLPLNKRTAIPLPDFAKDIDNQFASYALFLRNSCGDSSLQYGLVPNLKKSEAIFRDEIISTQVPQRVESFDASILYENNTGLRVHVKSLTPGICSYDEKLTKIQLLKEGECGIRLSLNSESIQTEIKDLERYFLVLENPKAVARSFQDRKDEVREHSIHLVYVVPRGRLDRNLDTNGQIVLWQQMANNWLMKKIQKKIQFDTYEGKLDISFLASEYSTSDLSYENENNEKKENSPLEKLFAEFSKQSKIVDGKSYFFVVDGDLSNDYCGIANISGKIGLMDLSNGCWDETIDDLGVGTGLSKGSKTLLHEVFHNFGVEHVCDDGNDLMKGGECPLERTKSLLLDFDLRDYIGGSRAGVNVLDLRVWEDMSGREFHLKEFCYIGRMCNFPKKYWTNGDRRLELQVKRGSRWIAVGTFSANSTTTMKGYPFTYEVSAMHIKSGIYTYRYVLKSSKRYRQFIDKSFEIRVPY